MNWWPFMIFTFLARDMLRFTGVPALKYQFGGSAMTIRYIVTEGKLVSVGRIMAPLILLGALVSGPADATPFTFSTGNPDGRMATSSRMGIPGGVASETADDFVLTSQTRITGATFYGLLPSSVSLVSFTQLQVAFYNVFPLDSTSPPSGNVPTRVNSPADSDISGARRDSSAGSLSYSTEILSPGFTAANSVIFGIHPGPNALTGGEGPQSGEEIGIGVTFTTPVILDAGHYFFRPQMLVTGGDLLWLSAPRPIISPGTPFLPDLQSWIRDDNLAPDWLRIGTDITGQGPFNAAFSLAGETIDGSGNVPEPSDWVILPGLLSFLALRWCRRVRV
jgi:hypothetical protein